MYPGLSATPATVRQGPLTRPRFAGVRHLSECCGESVYAAKFRGLRTAVAQDAADVEAVRATLAPTQAADDAQAAALIARARRSSKLGDDAQRTFVAAGRQEMTPERARAVVDASLDRADARMVEVAVSQRNKGNAVPVMVNGSLAIADAGSDPTVARARAAELRSSYRAPAPVNPLGLALTAPTMADLAASREFTPEGLNSQAAVKAAITAKASSPFGLGADEGVDPLTGETLTSSGAVQFPTSPAPTSPLKSPLVLGALALGAAFFLLRRR